MNRSMGAASRPSSKPWSLAALLASLATTAGAAESTPWVAPDRWFSYGLVLAVLVGSVVSLLLIRSALTVSPWSFSDALSEPTETTAMETDDSGHPRVRLGADGRPITIVQMRASSSRMIALMGTLVILLMFLGFGAVALFSFANTGTLPDSMDKVVNYLLAGLTLFAPYAVNQFSKIFESLSPRRG